MEDNIAISVSLCIFNYQSSACSRQRPITRSESVGKGVGFSESMQSLGNSKFGVRHLAGVAMDFTERDGIAQSIYLYTSVYLGSPFSFFTQTAVRFKPAWRRDSPFAGCVVAAAVIFALWFFVCSEPG
jgi:hypothetical protein